MKNLLFILSLFFSVFALAQTIGAKELLDKAITYHDPNNEWSTFNNSFTVEMTTPKSSKRVSTININLLEDYFSVRANRDSINTTYTINKGKCEMRYQNKVIDSSLAANKNMNCNRAELFKNYYTYLYGLPMKLKDPGSNLADKVEKKLFKGKEYLVLKVTYDKTVGKDIWYFYFNPSTYALEVYQFYKTDDNGNLNPKSGEYILLSDTETLGTIKMPKSRAWYYNKNDGYLGTDTLMKK